LSAEPTPPPKPRRRRRWLRRLGIVAALVAVALALLGIVAVRHLDWIAKFALHRIFPGVTAKLGSLRAVSATRLEVSQLTLQSARTHETLLSLEGGVIVFRFGDIWRAHLEEVRLKSPDLVVSPDLGEALGIQPARAESSPAAGRNFLNWAIGRLVVTDGHLLITRFGERSPSVEMQFAADFANFGVGGEAGHVEHTAQLAQISARDASEHEFLAITGIDVRFTTEELFTNQRVRAIHVGKGSLTIAPSLLAFFQPKGSASPTSPGVSRPGWTVGALALDGTDITIPNAPGVIGRATFHVTANLADLGAVGTPDANAEQQVTLSRVRVSSDAEPSIPLLTAAGAEARFTIAGLAARRVEELRLENPSININPDALLPPANNPPGAPAASSEAGTPASWLVAHASCKYGTLKLRGLQAGALDFTAHFAFDATDLGTLGDAASHPQEITVWDAQVAGRDGKPFLTLDVGSIAFTPAGLLQKKRIDAVKINGGRLTVGDALQKLLAANSGPAPAATASPSAPPPEPGWSLGTLDIAGVRTRIEDKRPGVTDLHFTINTSLHDVRAGSATSALLEEVQTVEFANIDLRSPLNRDAKILSLRSVFVRFTLRDLARKHLREVVILQPSIFLSQDLFVYMERASATDKPAVTGAPAVPAAPAAPNWSVDHLQVKFGRLVIGSGGSKDVGLPLEFETTADNLSLDNLAALQLQAILRVPKQSYEFSAYQLAVTDAVGDLRFSYPPEKGEKNLVQKLEIAGVRWRQYRAKQAWVAATFDASGINGLFGGEAYGGYVNGGFSFFFQDDSPWIGWVSGTGVDTRALTNVVSPENFSMTGPLDFEVQLDAFRKNIQRVRGVFHLTEPGRLKIGKLDSLIANIPPDWTAIKSSSTRIALETLRDFDYTTAGGDFWFVQSQGILNLDLRGPHGSRKFETVLHDGEETTDQWQQGKLGKP
jgi:hypothetical protein